MSPKMGEYTLQDDIARMAAHIADLDAHTFDVRELIRTGEYYTGGVSFQATKALTIDRLYGVPLILARAMTFDRLVIEVTVGGAGGTRARLGIYNNGPNLYPGSLLLDAGLVAVDAIAVVSLNIAQSLTKGIYWLAIISDGTPTVRAVNYVHNPIPVLGIYAASLDRTQTGWWKPDAFGALPDPFPAAATLNWDTTPGIAARVLSLD